jgi:hypothetical protein
LAIFSLVFLATIFSWWVTRKDVPALAIGIDEAVQWLKPDAFLTRTTS